MRVVAPQAGRENTHLGLRRSLLLVAGLVVYVGHEGVTFASKDTRYQRLIWPAAMLQITVPARASVVQQTNWPHTLTAGLWLAAVAGVVLASAWATLALLAWRRQTAQQATRPLAAAGYLES